MIPLHNFIAILAFAPAPPSGDGTGTIGGLFAFMFIALGFSFLCSLLEAGILSTSTSYIETQVNTGKRSALLMQKLKQDIDEPISAILTLNTIAHTVGAAGAGAQAVGVFGNEYFGIITAVLTFLILMFSEIIPKTLGAIYWKKLFVFNAYTIRALIILLWPAVWGFRAMTQMLEPEEAQPTVTRTELEVMAQISALEGALEEKENRILKNLLHLNGVPVDDIMTPRTVMLSFQQDMIVGDVVEANRQLPYSRIPIYDDNMDDITGFVLRHDIYKHAADDKESVALKELSRTIHSVPETAAATKVLDTFISRQDQIFLVLDEYGGTAGIVTLEDTLEALLGVEITDESDIATDMRQLATERFEQQILEQEQQTPDDEDEDPNGTPPAGTPAKPTP